MNQNALSPSTASKIRLRDRRCPVCGIPAAAMLATLPSGRRALVEACAVCGRQEATPVGPEESGEPVAGPKNPLTGTNGPFWATG